MTVAVRDNPARHRFEVHQDGRFAGALHYRPAANAIALVHTEVEPEFAGAGLGRALVGEVLARVRQQGLAVLPFCPYVRAVIARNPEQYLDLVRPADRERFGLPSA